uniref:Uncharacterized protein n=1 Tax=Glossina pallidipes TaxID=7398 RepID=A0A1A9ZZU8_GLOPL
MFLLDLNSSASSVPLKKVSNRELANVPTGRPPQVPTNVINPELVDVPISCSKLRKCYDYLDHLGQETSNAIVTVASHQSNFEGEEACCVLFTLKISSGPDSDKI